MSGFVDQEEFVRWMLSNMSVLSLSDKKAVLEGLQDLIRREEVSNQLDTGRES